MGTYAKKFQDSGLLFITNTVLNWNNLFLDRICTEIVMKSLLCCIEQQWINLFCYVLMPNHYHVIVRMLDGHKVENFLRDFHKFTSQKILFYLKDTRSNLLSQFYVEVKKQRYKIWMRDVDIKNVITPQFLLQKAEYIHNNPLSEKWRRILRVENPWDYPYSSATFYLKGQNDPFIPLADFRELV
ncbi:hypothetical protein ISS37_08615 [candidate division KSB1 bacterium]|nr:hypothetical protein [candidate division KSB1 bacterium]